jgi:magnesium transporter
MTALFCDFLGSLSSACFKMMCNYTSGVFTKRHSPPGSSPATLVPHLVEGQIRKPVIRVITYDHGQVQDSEIQNITALETNIDDKKVTWINVDGLGDLEVIQFLGERFKLHPLALEDVLNTGQRPKIEETSDYIFICMQMVYEGKDAAMQVEQVSMFLGAHFLITIQEEGDYDSFDPVRERIRSGRGFIRKSGADYLAYALLDSIIDHYYPALERIGAEIDELEDRMLEKPSRNIVFALHEQRRQLTQLRRYVWPLRDVVNAMLHESTGFTKKPTKVFLRDCYDHTVQLMDLVESQRELTASLMELYHSSVSLRTNDIMRVLTVITSIFIPLTFIVGVYGMNFAHESADGKRFPLNMPELHSPYGYVGVMAVMLFIAICQLILFRKMKWL